MIFSAGASTTPGGDRGVPARVVAGAGMTSPRTGRRTAGVGGPEGQVIALILALATLAAADVISLGYRTDLMVRVLEGSEVVDYFGYVTVRTPANPGLLVGSFLLLPARAAQGEAGQWLSLFAAECAP